MSILISIDISLNLMLTQYLEIIISWMESVRIEKLKSQERIIEGLDYFR